MYCLYAFKFDTIQFQQQVKPLLQALDQGDYEPLYAEYQKVVQTVESEEWILHDLGTSLEDYDRADIVKYGVSKYELGYWLFVFLSTFLEKGFVQLAYWDILYDALKMIGWSESEAELLFHGRPLVLLLKPEISEARFSIQEDDPYWYWMIPTQTFGRGWLPLEDVSILRDKLLSAKSRLFALDEDVVNSFLQLHKSFIVDNGKDVLAGLYHKALSMLDAAEQSRLGLFLVMPG